MVNVLQSRYGLAKRDPAPPVDRVGENGPGEIPPDGAQVGFTWD
jgi:hypothetical protein